MRAGYQVDGQRIGRLRTDLLGVTQREFAERCDLHWVTMSRIENSRVPVSLDTLERIADELGVDRDDLLPRDEDAALSADDDDEDDPVAALFNALDRVIDAKIAKAVKA